MVGKFLGILGVLLMSVLLQSFVFMLAEYHTVLQTVRDPIHLPVLFLGVAPSWSASPSRRG